MLGILILTFCHIVHVDREEVKGHTTSVCLRSPDAFFHLPTYTSLNLAAMTISLRVNVKTWKQNRSPQT